MVKQEACLCIFRKKIAENSSFQYALQMDREEQTRRVGLLVYLLGSIILGKQWFLVLL